MVFNRMLCLVLGLLTSAISAQQLQVYTEVLPPFQLVENEKVTGITTEKVKRLLDKAYIPYDLHVVPWPRAFNIVKTTPNTLIFSMNRTPEREPHFKWITVLAKISNSFISLSSSTLNINKLQDAQTHLTAVIRDGYAHSTLLGKGFVNNENMYVVATLDQQISLILKGKIDFLFTDIQTVQHALSLQGLDPKLVKVSFTDPSWTRELYLAANINTDPKTIELLSNQLMSE